MKALWCNAVLAESDDTIEIEGNTYFPRASVNDKYLEESDTTTECPWKGVAHYFDVVVKGVVNKDAAWYYPEPKEGSVSKVGKDFTNYVAFWNGIEIKK